MRDDTDAPDGTDDEGSGGNAAPASGGGTSSGGAGGASDGERTASGTRTVSLDEPAERTVDLVDATSDVGADPGTFLQRSGVKLFSWVLTATALVLLALFVNLSIELARLPDTPGGGTLTQAFLRGDTAQAIRLASQYRSVSEVAIAQRDSAWGHFVLGVKELVVTVFFPLLTGILGYIFGTRSESASGDQNAS